MTEQVVSLLRRRMIEDMTIRKFAPKTKQDCVQRVTGGGPLDRACALDGGSELRHPCK